MFDLIFDLFSAWNQVGLFLMATVFTLIGGGMVAYDLNWRMNAVKIKARIIDVRAHVTNKVKRNQIKSKAETTTSLTEDFKEKPISSVFAIFFVGLILCIPLVFFGFGAYKAYAYINLTSGGEYANARVVRNESSYDSDSGTSYKAIVAFTDMDGRIWELRDGISYGSKPSYKTGTRLGVYYDLENPKHFVIDDFWHNMTIALVFMGFGGAFICFGGFVAVLNKKSKSASESKDSGGQTYYYPVFEYQTKNGERHEKVGEWGSSSILSCLPGRRLKLMMMPNKPESVKRPQWFSLVFGLVFLMPGLFIYYIAVTTFEMTWAAPVLVLGIIGFVAFKLIGLVRKIPKDELRKGVKAFREQGFTISSSNNAHKGKILDDEEIRSHIQQGVKVSRFAAYLVLLIAIGLFVGAYYSSLDMTKRINNGAQTQGQVVGLKSRRSDDSYVYYATVLFMEQSGTKIRFEDSVGSSHPTLKKGDVVDVLYSLKNPHDAIIDRGIWNWSLSLGLGALAAFLLIIALHNFMLVRRYGVSRNRAWI